jgi:hypothetical protein
MKRFTSKFLLGVILSLSALLWWNFSDAAVPWQLFIPSEPDKPVETPVEKILADKNSYDGKEVFVSGTVSANLKLKTLKSGKEYTTFSLLSDSGKRIKVFFWGKLKLQGGLKVKVTGIYHKVKKVGEYTFRNEIEGAEIANP